MKAYNLKSINNLVYEDTPIPKIPKDWCLVKVKATGICSSDIPRIYKKGTYHFPTVPGHEFSGIVEKVSDLKDFFWVGKRVGVFPLIPCRGCRFCKEKKYEMCENYDYVGSRRDGAFAEYVAVPIWNLIELPNEISFKEAALLEPLAVALHAAKRGKINRGDTVAVIGTGMIGFAVAQWAKAIGAEQVVVYGRNEQKRYLVNNMDGIIYEVLGESKREFDVVVEAVGTNTSIINAIDKTKPGGKLVLMGNPEGAIHFSQDEYWRILRKQLNLIGTWNSSYESEQRSDWQEVIDMLANGKIKVKALISHCYRQQELETALQIMRDHTETFCKIVVEWNEEKI